MKPADLPFAHGDKEFSAVPELQGKFPRALRQLEKDVARELTDLSAEDLDRLLDPADLAEGGIKGASGGD